MIYSDFLYVLMLPFLLKMEAAARRSDPKYTKELPHEILDLKKSVRKSEGEIAYFRSNSEI